MALLKLSGAMRLVFFMLFISATFSFGAYGRALAAKTPSEGNVHKIPGKIEAEQHDAARSTGDLKMTFLEAKSAGDQWTYTVLAAKDAWYRIGLRTAADNTGGGFQLLADDKLLTGNLLIPGTGGADRWHLTRLSPVFLKKGSHRLTFKVTAPGFNFDRFELETDNQIAKTPGGFVHTKGKELVTAKGPLLLKGLNLGNWMLQEGYMMLTPKTAPAQHGIKTLITELAGPEATEKFYKEWRAQYIRKADIDSIAKWGYNHVRFVMHYNIYTPLDTADCFKETGFSLMDSVLAWCRPYNMYVIPDLHAAPGGQSVDNIADYDSTKKALWLSEAYRTKFSRFWKYFAQRYATDPLVAGYDVLNEPVWKMTQGAELRALYTDVTKAIREVDKNHTLYFEGNYYATDFKGLSPAWDSNMVYSFHKYWNATNSGSIYNYTKVGNENNAPLWCGEFGENSNQWITATLETFNKLNIGWTTWPYKKLDAISSPVSVVCPEGYRAMLNYWEGKGPKPSQAEAVKALDELVKSTRLENCLMHPDYVYACLKAPYSKNTKPFKNWSLPGRLPAVDYDLGQDGTSYHDKVSENTSEKPGGATNNGRTYRNDGVDIGFSKEENSPYLGWTEAGEWLAYTVTVRESGFYAFSLRHAGKAGKIKLTADTELTLATADIPATASDTDWKNLSTGIFRLEKGTHTLRLYVEEGGFNLNYLQFDKQSGK